jgi:hypothetical protein
LGEGKREKGGRVCWRTKQRNEYFSLRFAGRVFKVGGGDEGVRGMGGLLCGEILFADLEDIIAHMF